MFKTECAKKLLEEYVRRLVSEGSERLPPERDLALALGYSRSTIGKALGVLEAEGIVERKIGSGTFITENRPERHFTIALVMRNAYHCTDPHFKMIVDIVSAYAQQHNFDVQIFDRLQDMFRDSPDDNSLLRAIRSGVISGVLISSRMPVAIPGRISALCPAVSINNIFADGMEIPCVSCDYFRAGFLGGKYLLGKGHHKIAFLTETLGHPESIFDLSGFVSALEMGGHMLAPENILESNLNPDISSTKLHDFFLRTDCSACFVRSCSLATQVVGILKRMGRRIPEDVSIVAAGNYQNGRQSSVKLTTIDNRLDEMCRLGLQLLQAKCNNTKIPFGGLTLLEPRLVERDSVISLSQDQDCVPLGKTQSKPIEQKTSLSFQEKTTGMITDGAS